VADIAADNAVKRAAAKAREPRKPIDRARLSVYTGVIVLVLILSSSYIINTPYDPNATNPDLVARPPDAEFWFGTDLVGRDIFSRVISASRRDLPLALIGTLVSLLIGVPIGLLVSVKSRWSEIVMRGLDALQSFPLMILAIAIVTLTGNRLENVIIAIAIINGPRFIRIVRSEALSLRERRFIEAAIAIGASPVRIMFRHLLPNVTGMILAQSSLSAANAILAIAALNYIGFGVTPPDASWGSMLQAGARNAIQGQWWMAGFPALAVILSVFSLNLIADGVEAMGRGRV
jgi:peptide/nickel transport system permease protein